MIIDEPIAYAVRLVEGICRVAASAAMEYHSPNLMDFWGK
jgi:hypothetical protein